MYPQPTVNLLTDVIDCSGYVFAYTMRHHYHHPQYPSSMILTYTTLRRTLSNPYTRLTRHSRLRCALPQPEPDQALLAELRRLPQVHPRQGRGLQALPSGTRLLLWSNNNLLTPTLSSSSPTDPSAPVVGPQDGTTSAVSLQSLHNMRIPRVCRSLSIAENGTFPARLDE